MSCVSQWAKLESLFLYGEKEWMISSLVEGEWKAVVFMTNPNKISSTYMVPFHTCLTVGPIKLFISFYKRAAWISRAYYSSVLKPVFVGVSRVGSPIKNMFIKEWPFENKMWKLKLFLPYKRILCFSRCPSLFDVAPSIGH